MVQEIQTQTTRFALIGLGVAGLLLLALSTRFPGSTWIIVLGLGLLGLDYFLWRVSRHSLVAASFLLATLFAAADLLLVHFARIETAVFLLVLPAGFATLMFNARGGVSAASLISLIFVFASPELLPVSTDARVVCAVVAWGIVLMTWLALRPLFETVEWAWYGYKQYRLLLEESRDSRQRLEQALEEVKLANAQMTRLNRLAQNLRQQAEEAEHAKMRFVANVSHELRTPLNMVIRVVPE